MKYAIVFSETGCDAVVEAETAIEAIHKVDPIFRYSSSVCESPEYDKFSTAEKKGAVKIFTGSECRDSVTWINDVGQDDREGYPSLATEKDFTVFCPNKGDQAIYVYQTYHPVCGNYYKYWSEK